MNREKWYNKYRIPRPKLKQRIKFLYWKKFNKEKYEKIINLCRKEWEEFVDNVDQFLAYGGFEN